MKSKERNLEAEKIRLRLPIGLTACFAPSCSYSQTHFSIRWKKPLLIADAPNHYDPLQEKQMRGG